MSNQYTSINWLAILVYVNKTLFLICYGVLAYKDSSFCHILPSPSMEPFIGAQMQIADTILHNNAWPIFIDCWIWSDPVSYFLKPRRQISLETPPHEIVRSSFSYSSNNIEYFVKAASRGCLSWLMNVNQHTAYDCFVTIGTTQQHLNLLPASGCQVKKWNIYEVENWRQDWRIVFRCICVPVEFEANENKNLLDGKPCWYCWSGSSADTVY